MPVRHDVVRRAQETPDGGLQSQRRQRVAGDELLHGGFCVARTDDHLAPDGHPEQHHVGVPVGARDVSPGRRIVEVVTKVRALIGIQKRLRQDEQARRIRDGQWTQQHGVDEAERGKRGTHRQTERQHGGQARDSVTNDLAPSEHHVGAERIEPRESTLIAKWVESVCDPAGLQARQPRRFGRWMSSFGFACRGELEMRPQLFLQIRVGPCRSQRAPQSP